MCQGMYQGWIQAREAMDTCVGRIQIKMGYLLPGCHVQSRHVPRYVSGVDPGWGTYCWVVMYRVIMCQGMYQGWIQDGVPTAGLSCTESSCAKVCIRGGSRMGYLLLGCHVQSRHVPRYVSGVDPGWGGNGYMCGADPDQDGVPTAGLSCTESSCAKVCIRGGSRMGYLLLDYHVQSHHVPRYISIT